MKNAVFYGYKNPVRTSQENYYVSATEPRRFEKTLSLVQLLLATNTFPSSLILSTLMMEAICSSETSIPIRTTRRHIPEDGISYSHRRENFKFYISTTVLLYLRYTAKEHLELTFLSRLAILTKSLQLALQYEGATLQNRKPNTALVKADDLKVSICKVQ
jgi:hypothetical protein